MFIIIMKRKRNYHDNLIYICDLEILKLNNFKDKIIFVIFKKSENY
jgi:hypothetical protein